MPANGPPANVSGPLDALPPLKAVEAFVAVAKVGSFTDAATALGLSVSTLSRRLKTLENHLGEKLLERGRGRVDLTAAGKAYLDAAEKAIAALATGRNDAHHAERVSVAVTAPQFFVRMFIAEHLSGFESQHPDIELTFDTSPRLADLRREGFDLAVRFGMGDWPGLHVEPVFISAGGPACGPKLANGRELPRRIEALCNHTLLHFRQEPLAWSRFLASAGCKHVKGETDRYFDDADLLYAAACQGLGVALIDPDLVRPLLDEGRLVRPIDIDIVTGDGFHFVFAPGAEAKPAVRRFCDWVLSLAFIRRLRAREARFAV